MLKRTLLPSGAVALIILMSAATSTTPGLPGCPFNPPDSYCEILTGEIGGCYDFEECQEIDTGECPEGGKVGAWYDECGCSVADAWCEYAGGEKEECHDQDPNWHIILCSYEAGKH